MLMLMQNRLVLLIAMILLVLLNVLHPLFHFIEGGSLDASIVQLNCWACLVLNERNADV